MGTGILKRLAVGTGMLAACASLAFTAGCSDDDAPSATVVGTWTVLKAEGYEIKDGVKDTYWDTYAAGQLTMEFQPDGTGVEVDKINAEIPEYKPFTYKYASGADLLLINYKDGEKHYDVENLTSSLMSISRTTGAEAGINESFIRYYMSRLK